jgi:hypothetical protein
VNPIQQAISAFEEIIAAGKAAKEALDKDLPVGDPVHPVSGRLTWPLSSCLMAVESLRSLQKEVEGALPKAEAWRYRFHTDESLAGGVNVRRWVLTENEPPESQDDFQSEPLYTADQLRTAVAAALGRGAGQADWRPIRTAPKDGTHILAALPDRDSCYVICWADASKNIREYLGNEVGWHMAYDGDFLQPHDEPTHWIPLPSVPSETPEATQPTHLATSDPEGHRQAIADHEATQPTQAEVVSDREALSVIAAFPITDEKNMDAVNMRDVARRAVVRAALATQQAGQGEAVASESALASLIDLICPGLDSGDILADAQEAMRALNERTSQPESKARAVQRFHRDTFNAAAWVTQLTKAVEARGVTWAQVSEETGVSTTTLSRVRSGERQPDAASLAALSAWAGLNPANYCATPPAPGQVERDREDGK